MKVLMLSLLSIGTFFASCTNDIEVVKELGQEDKAPFQTVHNGLYTFTDSGKVRNTLEAGKLEQYIHDTDYTHVSDGLILQIFDRQEQLNGKLHAEQGYYFKDLQRMQGLGNVIFTNPKGDSLFTEELIWESDSHLIYTEKLVRIQRQGTVIRGKGLRAKEDFSRYTILAPVGDIILPEQEDGSENTE